MSDRTPAGVATESFTPSALVCACVCVYIIYVILHIIIYYCACKDAIATQHMYTIRTYIHTLYIIHYVIQSQHYKSPPSAVFSGKGFSIFLYRSRVVLVRQSCALCPTPSWYYTKSRFLRRLVAWGRQSLYAVCKHHIIIVHRENLWFIVRFLFDISCLFTTMSLYCSWHAAREMRTCAGNEFISTKRLRHYIVWPFRVKTETAVCVHDTIRSDRILFYTFRVFPRNRHEFQTTVNALGCSYCCRYIRIIAISTIHI